VLHMPEGFTASTPRPGRNVSRPRQEARRRSRPAGMFARSGELPHGVETRGRDVRVRYSRATQSTPRPSVDVLFILRSLWRRNCTGQYSPAWVGWGQRSARHAPGRGVHDRQDEATCVVYGCPRGKSPWKLLLSPPLDRIAPRLLNASTLRRRPCDAAAGDRRASVVSRHFDPALPSEAGRDSVLRADDSVLQLDLSGAVGASDRFRQGPNMRLYQG